MKKKCPWARNNPQVFKKGMTPWNKGLIVKTRHICKFCGKEFIRNKKYAKFCSIGCSSKSQINKIVSYPTLYKLRISHLGKKLSEEQKKRIGDRSRGHRLSDESKRKISIANSGSNCGSWKGGISSLVELIRHCSKSRDWAREIFKRDRWKCQKCKTKERKVIHPHHLIHFAQILREFLSVHNHLSPIDDKQKLLKLAKEYSPFWNLDNGITLCIDCHQEIHPELTLTMIR